MRICIYIYIYVLKPGFSVASVSCSVGLQFIYTAVSIYLSNVPGTEHDFRIQYMIYPLILALLWPVVLIISCEMMKRRHIK